MMTHKRRFSKAIQARHELRRLCSEAIRQQIERGQAAPTHLRNRRRHLARQVLKMIPAPIKRSPKKLLHAAAMVLAMWGFSTGMPYMANAAPDFRHVMLNGFLAGAELAPAFADIDGDGDLDAFVGEVLGSVKFYRNDDTSGNGSAPIFVPVAGAGNPLNGFDVGYDAKPTFIDIDGDGDLDAFIGNEGSVRFYRNDDSSGNGTVPNFMPVAGAGNPLNSVSLVARAMPTFADIDGDGDLDAFVGEAGSVKFYRNDDASGTGTAPNFVPVAGAGNPLNGVYLGFSSHSPTLTDIDGDGDLDAFVGDVYGTVHFYRNDDASGNGMAPIFVPVVGASNPLNGIDVGIAASPTFVDIDSDGDFDAFVGEGLGSVVFFRNDDTSGNGAAPNFVEGTGNPLFGFYVGNPVGATFADIDGDGDFDAFVGKAGGTVNFYRNDDTSGTGTAPDFVAVAGTGNPLNGVTLGYYSGNTMATFADIDGDGDLDAFVSNMYSVVQFYRNDDTSGNGSAPNFVPVSGVGNPLNAFFIASNVVFADIDGDGDLDLFTRFGNLVGFARNDDTSGNGSAPNFVPVYGAGNPLNGVNVSNGPYVDFSLTFADIDDDGDLDAFIGSGYDPVGFYRNDDASGNGSAPNFVAVAGAGDPLDGFGAASFAFVDINGDGDLDAFAGGNFGTVQFFENFENPAVRAVGNDANGDGKSDILWRNTATGLNYLYMMNGTTIVSQGAIDVVPGPDWQIVGTGDYDGNNTADILWRNGVTGENLIYFMDGNTIVSQGTILTVGDTNWQVAGSGNYDGLGGDDILWRHAVSGQNHIWFMNGLTIASQGTVNFVPSNWQVVGNGDLDADGKSDILWRNSLNGRNHAYLMNGHVIASQGTINTVPLNWEIAGTGDYNGDRKADILWRNTLNGRNHMYFLDGFSIASQGTVNTVPLNWDIVGDGDYDGDGKADILWRNMTNGRNFMYFMNGNVIASSGVVNTVSNFNWVIVAAP